MKKLVLFFFVSIGLHVQAGIIPYLSKVSQTNQATVSRSMAGCTMPSAKMEMNINNIRSTILTAGDFWWNTNSSCFEYPKGSGKNLMFSGSFWVGSIDANNTVHMAAQTYRQTGTDFFSGPLDESGATTANKCQEFDRVWRVNRKDVKNFVLSGSTSVKDIKEWPGQYAPYFDKNGDGNYKAVDGDYPYFNFKNIPGNEFTNFSMIPGDQALFWIFNDAGNSHSESKGEPLGLQFNVLAYGFENNKDSLYNVQFYRYEMINKSTNSLLKLHTGIYSDCDLGYPFDDNIGCDARRGIGYGYNGDADDEAGSGSPGYGRQCPMVAIDMFQQMPADPNDKLDNDHDGFTDEEGETISLSTFLYYNNSNNVNNGNPNGALHFYNYLKGIWGDNVPMSYGGNGYGGTDYCYFMFPGKTDLDSGARQPWYDGLPGDKRMVCGYGPLSLKPGDVRHFTFGAYVLPFKAGENLETTITRLGIVDDGIQRLFDTTHFTTSTPSLPIKEQVLVYPNPWRVGVSEYLNFTKGFENAEIQLYNMGGMQVYQGVLSGNQWMPSSDLAPGNYIIKLTSKSKVSTVKWVKQ